MTRISASVLGADLLRLGEEIEMAERSGVQWLHLDHMDGHFTPNISFGPAFVQAIRKKTKLFLDVHLMFTNPMEYIDVYTRAGSDMITVHVETKDDTEEMLKKIRRNGLKAGICINPHTNPKEIRRFLPLCDHVLVMTVEPGFGGQKLRPYCLEKVTTIRAMIEDAKLDHAITIAVDGGIKEDNAALAVHAGADVLVMGTGIFCAEDPAQVVRTICSETGNV